MPLRVVYDTSAVSGYYRSERMILLEQTVKVGLDERL